MAGPQVCGELIVTLWPVMSSWRAYVGPPSCYTQQFGLSNDYMELFQVLVKGWQRYLQVNFEGRPCEKKVNKRWLTPASRYRSVIVPSPLASVPWIQHKHISAEFSHGNCKGRHWDQEQRTNTCFVPTLGSLRHPGIGFEPLRYIHQATGRLCSRLCVAGTHE